MLAIDALLGRIRNAPVGVPKPWPGFADRRPVRQLVWARRPPPALLVTAWAGLTGFTKEENDRKLDKAAEGWNAKGRDGEQMRRYFFQSRCDTLGANAHKGRSISGRRALQRSCARPSPPASRTVRASCTRCRATSTLSWVRRCSGRTPSTSRISSSSNIPNMTSFTIQSVDLFLPTTEWLEYDSYVGARHAFQPPLRALRRDASWRDGQPVRVALSGWQIGGSAPWRGKLLRSGCVQTAVLLRDGRSRTRRMGRADGAQLMG